MDEVPYPYFDLLKGNIYQCVFKEVNQIKEGLYNMHINDYKKKTTLS